MFEPFITLKVILVSAFFFLLLVVFSLRRVTRSDLRRGLFSKVKTGEDGFVSDSYWSCSDGDRRDRSCQILTGREPVNDMARSVSGLKDLLILTVTVIAYATDRATTASTTMTTITGLVNCISITI